jgi:hypothetical protein
LAIDQDQTRHSLSKEPKSLGSFFYVIQQLFDGRNEGSFLQVQQQSNKFNPSNLKQNRPTLCNDQ